MNTSPHSQLQTQTHFACVSELFLFFPDCLFLHFLLLLSLSSLYQHTKHPMRGKSDHLSIDVSPELEPPPPSSLGAPSPPATAVDVPVRGEPAVSKEITCKSKPFIYPLSLEYLSSGSFVFSSLSCKLLSFLCLFEPPHSGITAIGSICAGGVYSTGGGCFIVLVGS